MTRRMTLIVLVLLGVMVLVVTVSPPDQAVRDRAGATPTPAPSTPPLTDPDAYDVSAKLSADEGAEAKTVDAEVGDRVEITVEGTETDSVALGDLSVDDVEAGDPAHFELLADTPGTYPLVLFNDQRQIGRLEIR